MAAGKRSTLHLLRSIRDSQMTQGSKRRVLDAIALRANHKTWITFPSYATLRRDTGLAPSTLKAAVAWLKKNQLVKVKGRTNNSNVYFINYEKIETRADENVAKWKDEKEQWLKSLVGDLETTDETSDEEAFG